MSASRSSPASTAGDITGHAIENTIVSAILIPVFQIVFLAFMDAMHALPNVDGSVFAILNASLLLLVVWPILSTVAATAVSYTAAGALGVFLYYFVAILFSAILGAGLTLLLIAFTGFILLLLYTTLEANTANSSVPLR